MAELVVARTFLDQSEAVVAKSCLEAHGFVVVLLDTYASTTAWHYMFALQGIRLCVLDGSISDARLLLDEAVAEAETIPTIVAHNIIIAVFTTVFAGIPYPVRRFTYPRTRPG